MSEINKLLRTQARVTAIKLEMRVTAALGQFSPGCGRAPMWSTSAREQYERKSRQLQRSLAILSARRARLTQPALP